jgi:hypothetical protein
MSWFSRHILFAAALLASALPARAAEQTDQRTHILAIAACPPRPVIGIRSTQACERFLPQISTALAQRLGAEPGDVHRLLNEQATAPAVLKAVHDIGKRLRRNDRLVVYQLSHGGGIARATGEEEVFMLWTAAPIFLQLGVAEGVYLPAADLAAAVHASGAGEVVVLLDGCETGLARPDFISRHPAKRADRPEAVVTSSRGEQYSMMDLDFSPVFGARLLAALQRANATLADAVDEASAATSRDAPDICRAMLKHYSPPNAAPIDPSICAQDPARDDATRLLTRIPLRPVQRAASN